MATIRVSLKSHQLPCPLQLAVTMTIQHLRYAGVPISTIHDFLTSDIGVASRLVNRFINLSAAELEAAQARTFLAKEVAFLPATAERLFSLARVAQ